MSDNSPPAYPNVDKALPSPPPPPPLPTRSSSRAEEERASSSPAEQSRRGSYILGAAGPSSYGSARTSIDAPTDEHIARFKRDSISASRRSSTGISTPASGLDPSTPSSGPSSETEPAASADATAENDGTIGVEINVQNGSRFLQGLSALGILKGEGRVWDAKRPWDFSKADVNYDHPRKGCLASGSDAGGSKSDQGEEGRKADGGGKAKGKGKAKAKSELLRIPPMSIVIFIVGSRGDVQPYIALALALITHAGHRVRLATHPDFRQFVLSANSRLRGKTHESVPLEGRLEFFDAGGDPKELMAYMVKKSLFNGDIGKKRAMAAEYLRGFYLSTFSPDVVSGREFAADAIISNPPAFAHIHVAQALGVPLHMSFTTTAFPHPLVNVKKSNADQWATNWMGFHLADMLMWEGLGGIINDFRTSILRLDSIPERTASGILDHLRISWTYCWSPELLPKPKDWRSNIDISGFYFLDGEDDFVPPADLAEFLGKGKAPVYIGFGSVVIPDPETMTDMIFEAVEKAGVRAIVSSGWAGLGKGKEESNPDIFILSKDCSHEWLFANDRVAAVCHHGGAGTTSCGLRHGRPSIIVPFFGDQKFWGDAVHNAGAGPAPIPIKTLSVENLTAALQFACSEEASVAAGILGEKIRAEKGEEKGVESFTRNMPLHDLCCDADPRKVAVWWCPMFALKLSVDAAAAMISAQKIMFDDLEPYRTFFISKAESGCKEYDVTKHSSGPLAGTGGAMSTLVSTTFSATGQLFYSPFKGISNMFYGIPESALGVVADMYDGFDNLSRKMGSTPRPRGTVTDWKSGFKEGGKSLGWGLWDGITGVFTEPVDGARREGFAGFGKGIGRGFANMLNRPLAGSLGIFVLPTRGIRASIRASLGQQQDPHSVLRGPREALTRQAVIDLSPEAKQRLMDTVTLLEGETKKRRQKQKRTQWVLMADKRERAEQKLDRQRDGEERKRRKEIRRALEDKERAEKVERRAQKKAGKRKGTENGTEEVDQADV